MNDEQSTTKLESKITSRLVTAFILLFLWSLAAGFLNVDEKPQFYQAAQHWFGNVLVYLSNALLQLFGLAGFTIDHATNTFLLANSKSIEVNSYYFGLSLMGLYTLPVWLVPYKLSTKLWVTLGVLGIVVINVVRLAGLVYVNSRFSASPDINSHHIFRLLGAAYILGVWYMLYRQKTAFWHKVWGWIKNTSLGYLLLKLGLIIILFKMIPFVTDLLKANLSGIFCAFSAWLTGVTLSISQVIVNIFGYDSIIQGDMLRDASVGVYLGYGCLGVELIFFTTACLWLFKGNPLYKTAYILVAVVGLVLLNALRISLLYFTLDLYKDLVEFNHKFLFNIIIYTYLFFAIVGWLKYFDKGTYNKILGISLNM